MRRSEREELQRLLSDILYWGERVDAHTATLDEQSFLADPAAADAVCWCISCIGEAAGTIRRRWPELDGELQLSEAYAMRNRIAHGYFAIDLGIVWLAARQSVPHIVSAARKKLNEL